jgi:hypothetical protein
MMRFSSNGAETMNYRVIAVCALVVSLMPWTIFAGDKRKFTDEFPLGECQFKTRGDNRYFILKPGLQFRFNNFRCFAEGECDDREEVIITVLHETRDITLEIDGEMRTVTTRVVKEREKVNGQLAEISRNFFAECDGTQDVYYFGEKVNIYEGGKIVSHEGEWLAGKDGARPGLIMPGLFLLGARYFQEIAKVAMDRAEHVDMGLTIEVPAGDFEDCVQVDETTPLDPKSLSTKIYCPGTGLVFDDGLELISVVEQ